MERATDLIHTNELAIRFSEVDSLGIVWHGHYLKYFEDGREAFGTKYGIGYLDVYKAGLVIPLVKIDIDYKRSLTYGDKFIVETRYVDTEAAKLIFNYTIKNAATGQIVATGKSIQVFLDEKKRELSLNVPDFILDWKKKMGLSK